MKQNIQLCVLVLFLLPSLTFASFESSLHCYDPEGHLLSVSSVVSVVKYSKSPDVFRYSKQGFINFTNTALDIVTRPGTLERSLTGGRTAYFQRIDDAGNGIIVFVQNGRLQSMFDATLKYFTETIH